VRSELFSDNVMINNIIIGSKPGQVGIDWDAVPGDLVFESNTIRQGAPGQDVFWWLDKPGADDYFTLAEIEAAYPQSYAGNTEHDPSFVDAAGGDFHLGVGSQCIDAGAPLTTTTTAGSGTQVPVKDALFFSDGYGIVDADVIVVGLERVTIVKVDYTANQLTVDRSITWSANAGVFTDFHGAGPDVGAFESGAPAADGGGGDLGSGDLGAGDGPRSDGGGVQDGAGDAQPGSSADGGCGCRVLEPAVDGLPLVLGLLAALWLVRRRG